MNIDTDRQQLIDKYLALGYSRHLLPEGGTGVVLTHPGFDKLEGEVNNTLPIALIYASFGHLVVLFPPGKNEKGRNISSIDGFIDTEAQLIEFKHCTTGTANNIYNNLSDAGKDGKTMIRSIWITDKANPEIIAETLSKKYRLSKRMNLVHVIYKGRILEFTRTFFESEGWQGILDKF